MKKMYEAEDKMLLGTDYAYSDAVIFNVIDGEIWFMVYGG